MMIADKMKYCHLYRKEYGFKCLCLFVMCAVFPYSRFRSGFSWWLLQQKHKAVLSYLESHYYQANGSGNPEKTHCVQADTIWTAWLQGEENAPEVIRMTLAFMKKNAGGHKIIVLSDDTISRYIDIPAEIKEKHKQKIIGNAHYADIVRMMVLKKYGGFWLDATTFVHEPLNEMAFSQPFFSYGTRKCRTPFVSANRWIVGMIGGCKNSLFLARISDMLNAYWREHTIPIDYFVFDYLIEVLYRNDRSFARLVDSLPRMDFRTTYIHEFINEPYDEEKTGSLMKKDQLYFLSYKKTYQKKSANGTETLYGHLYQSAYSKG